MLTLKPFTANTGSTSNVVPWYHTNLYRPLIKPIPNLYQTLIKPYQTHIKPISNLFQTLIKPISNPYQIGFDMVWFKGLIKVWYGLPISNPYQTLIKPYQTHIKPLSNPYQTFINFIKPLSNLYHILTLIKPLSNPCQTFIKPLIIMVLCCLSFLWLPKVNLTKPRKLLNPALSNEI